MIKKIPLFIILSGAIVHSLVMLKSGQIYHFGMGFWGPNAHDGLWHISLINQLSSFSFRHPLFPPEILTNYHYGFDLFVGILHRLTSIPAINLYFHILPFIFSASIGCLLYQVTNKLFGVKASIWSLLFYYFGGSFGYLVTLSRGDGLGGESLFWSIQPISFSLNPPLSLSLVILLFSLLLIIQYLQKQSLIRFIIISSLIGSLIIIKVYAGLIALSALFATALIQYLLFKQKSLFAPAVLSFFISASIFSLTNKGGVTLVEFNPLWFPRSMMESIDRVGWTRFAQARSTYQSGHNLFKLFPAEIFGILVFICGNLGTRIILFFYPLVYKKSKTTSQPITFIFLKNAALNFPLSLRLPLPSLTKSDSHKSLPKIFIILCLIISFIPTLLFVQKGNPWNIIQFFYYTILFSSIIAGVVASRIYSLLPSSFLKLFFTVLILITSLPGSLPTLANYLPARPPAAVSPQELEALRFLSSQVKGIVLTFPYQKSRFDHFVEPRPLYAYESTAYVSALSKHTSFLEDEVNLEISQYPWRQRRQEIQSFFSSQDNLFAKSFLKTNNINYIYLTDNQKLPLLPDQIGLSLIYTDPVGINIYKFDNIII